MPGPEQTMTFEESIRKRPFMFIGTLVELFKGILLDCIKLSHAERSLFVISLLEENKFLIEISSEASLSAFVDQFKVKTSSPHYFPTVLAAVTSTLHITENRAALHKITLAFEFNTAVISKTRIDFQKASEMAFLFAVLNRHSEIILKDLSSKHLNQNYYHFPEGIFYLYEQGKEDALRQPACEIFFDGKINGLSYQVALGYRTDWHTAPFVMSFANDVYTMNGGSLVAGVMDGFIAACKKYCVDESLAAYKIKRKKFNNGLILVCSVKGGDFNYTGSTKECLADDKVRKDIKKAIFELALGSMKSDPAKAKEFLYRFDETQLLHKLFE